MSNIHQSSNPIKNRHWAVLLPVLLLAPLAMAPKGCNSVVVGDDCPDLAQCTAGAAGTVGAAGSAGRPTGSAGSAGGKPTGMGGACGGLLGLTCAASEYCAFDAKAACGAADQTGVCTPRPQVCLDIYLPVCACDGQTYGNDCEAATNGSSVAHTGVCENTTPGASCGGLKAGACAKSEYCNYPPETKCGSGDQTGTCAKLPDACDTQYEPVCGCDNATYSNSCFAALKGISVLHSGACDGPAPGAVCGGLKGATCDKGEFCNFAPETKCGSGDQTGTCTTIPTGCDKSLVPVCGCDGKTYGNACNAAAAGISVASQGECAANGPTCGGLQGLACPKGANCVYPIEAQCGAADQTGTCMAPTGGPCPQIYDPVCGCNGTTYGNACMAAAAAASVAATGACNVTCGGKLGGQCADNQYCNYPISANCGKADATGTCSVKIDGACTANYDPVCGCDGKTYGNDCEAGRAGVSIAAKGECP